MATTIRDVAKRAGVNASTVSRVLNGKASVTEDTRRRIHIAMKELDYHPNSFARSLANGASGMIGMVLDTGDESAFSNAFFSSSQFSIERVAQERGYHMVIANGGPNAGNAVVNLLLERKVDGLILPPSTATPALMEKIGDFPFVFLGQPDSVHQGASWVDIHNQLGAEIAVRHLYQRGYQRAAYLGGDARHGMSFISRRVLGYRAALHEGAPEWVLPTDGTVECARRMARGVLEGTDRPDAFLCDDNLTAYGMLQAAQEMGFVVPRELGVITFNNYPLAPYVRPSLTAVDIDTALLGEETALLLFDRMNGRATHRQILLEPSLIERESTCRSEETLRNRLQKSQGKEESP